MNISFNSFNLLLSIYFDNLIINVNFFFKYLINKLSFIYYISIFFWVFKNLIYFSISLISHFNHKHSSNYLKVNYRPLSSFFIKYFNTNNSKKNYIKMFIKMYI